MRLLLIRHGLTDANAGGVIQGHRPTPLNSQGLRQAQLLAQRLSASGLKLDSLISSDLARAAQTAEALSTKLSVPVHLDAAWRERCMGELEGKSRSDGEIWRAASGLDHPIGAEAEMDFRSRIRNSILGLARQWPDEANLAVVTHGGPVHMALRLFIAGELGYVRSDCLLELVPIANCSIMELISHNRGDRVDWEIMRLNDVTHLAGDQTDADAG